jgi:hypothetical protein
LFSSCSTPTLVQNIFSPSICSQTMSPDSNIPETHDKRSHNFWIFFKNTDNMNFANSQWMGN